ncbi:MAG: hypothetical protein AAF598_16420, partial [Bacteroidota bacterium]
TALDCQLKSDGLMYILVRNPWGHTSRGYKKAKEVLKGIHTEMAKEMKISGISAFKSITAETIKGMSYDKLEIALERCGLDEYFEEEMNERKSISRFSPNDLVPYELTKSKETGESWIELSDFTKRFYSIEVV